MGIESDQLVFDYLSRVGDLAHGTRMTAAERARLVSGLRADIDRIRAEQGGADSKAAVRRILDQLGTPEDLVSAANGGGTVPGVPAPRPADGGSGSGGGGERPRRGGGLGGLAGLGGLGFGGTGGSGGTAGTSGGTGGTGTTAGTGSGPWTARLPRLPQQLRKEPRDPAPPAEPTATASRGASPPHLAGIDELGPEESDPDWWRTDPHARGPYERGGPYEGGGQHGPERPGNDIVPGFVGGIELPELLKQSDDEDGADGAPERPSVPGPRPGVPGMERAGGAPEAPVTGPPDGPVEQAGRPKRFRPFGGERGAGGPRVGGLVELLGVALLAAGTVVGHLALLGAGWLLAWWSPRLSRTEAQWAAVGMPGLVAVCTGVWLWGRSDGRWGAAIPDAEGAMSDALGDAWPVVLRLAAAASALFLLWRARRPLPED
ncbi:hypothetical protein [Streptomyces sp. NPDC054784]